MAEKTPIKSPPIKGTHNQDDVLRRMLNTPPKPKLAKSPAQKPKPRPKQG